MRRHAAPPPPPPPAPKPAHEAQHAVDAKPSEPEHAKDTTHAKASDKDKLLEMDANPYKQRE